MFGIFFINQVISLNSKPTVKCKRYGGTSVRGGNKYRTSTLNHHMLKYDGIKKLRQTHIPSNILNLQGKLRSSKLDQKIFREKFAKAFIRHDVPFKFVEYEGFKDLFRYLNPDVKFISKMTASSDVLKVYIEPKKKGNLKDYLSKIHGKVCLTSDL